MFINYKPVRIGSACNFNCVVCDCDKTASGNLSTEELVLRLTSISEKENIEFTGGELFIRKDMETIIKFAAARFGSVKYNTNGAVFVYKNVLEKATANGMRTVYLKFFSTRPEIHAAITKTDSLKYVIEGFENLVERQNKAYVPVYDKWETACFLAVNLFVHSMTLPTIEETARYLSSKEIPRLILDFTHSDCVSDDAMQAARACLEVSAGNGTWAVTRGLPVCAMRGFEEHCGDVYRIERFIPGNVFIPGICEDCILYTTCGGVSAAVTDKRQWAPITARSGIKNLDDIIFFHSHISAQRPLTSRGGAQ